MRTPSKCRLEGINRLLIYAQRRQRLPDDLEICIFICYGPDYQFVNLRFQESVQAVYLTAENLANTSHIIQVFESKIQCVYLVDSILVMLL